MIRVYVQIVLVVAMFTLTCVYPAFAIDAHLLKAKVSGIDARPMEGAKLFLYESSNVRRAADFISSQTDRAGQIQIVLPPGKYWVVARYKSDGKYGPLLPGDKHSGEPLEVDLTGGGADADFVVADIRELGQKKRASATDLLRLKGRVVDTQGAPVAQAFVFANIANKFSEMPDYISAWTGDDGVYELYLPPGVRYFAGVSRQFPMKSQDGFITPLVIDPGKIDIAIDIDLTTQ